MTEQLPDIEIYIKRAALADILAWLALHFEVGEQRTAGDTIKVPLTHTGRPLTCTIFEQAARGGYVSVLFEPNETPWGNDEHCALDAYHHFDLEVRCITGSWTADSADTGGWYRFTDEGKVVVNWLA